MDTPPSKRGGLLFNRDQRFYDDPKAHEIDPFKHQKAGAGGSVTLGTGNTILIQDKSVQYVKLFGNQGFTALSHIDDGGSAYDVAAGTSHIFLANYDDSLRAYTISAGGATLTNVAHYVDPGGPLYTGIHSAGNGIVFVADDGPATLDAFSFSAGTFTLLDSVNHPGSFAFDVTYDGTYVYMACGPSGVRAYTWVGNSLTHKATLDLGGASGSARGIWANGGYIFVANWQDGLRAYSYAGGATITNVAHMDVGGSAYGVHGYGDYIFVANWDGIEAFFWDGTNEAFTHLSSYDPGTGGDARDIWTDGVRPYFADNEDGIRAASWSGEQLAELAHLDNTPDFAYGIDGDAAANRIYLACRQDGLRAYSFGGATANLETITGAQNLKLLIIEFQDNLITVIDDDTHAANTIDLTGTAANLQSADDMILMLAYNGTSWYQAAPASAN